MISPTPNPLKLPSFCHQASCWFEREAYSDEQCERFGIVLPERLSSAVGKRKAEFLAGRYCVRLALKDMGADCSPQVEIGEKRAPRWPQGLIGSITHSKGFASAAVASTASVRGVGIDSEGLIGERTASNVASHILTEGETYESNRALVDSARQYLTLIFSAKESIFKCLYPQVQQYFDFRDAEVFLSVDQPGHFRFRLRKQLNHEFPDGYSAGGQYALVDDFVHTAVVLGGD